MAGDNIVGLPYSQSALWRRERNEEGVRLLLAAVGVEPPHPVAAAIHERFSGVFVLVPGGASGPWLKARDTLHWMNTPAFKEQVARWRELATVAPEYVEGLL